MLKEWSQQVTESFSQFFMCFFHPKKIGWFSVMQERILQLEFQNFNGVIEGTEYWILRELLEKESPNFIDDETRVVSELFLKPKLSANSKYSESINERYANDPLEV